MALVDPSVRDPKRPEAGCGGEHLVLVQPHIQNDGRRCWAVMATYDHDELVHARALAESYEEKGHVAAVAQVILETDWENKPA